MEVKDLQPNQGKVDLVLTITEKSEPRTFEKFGKSGSVCKAKANDETGTVTITLWNDDIDKVKVGDKIHVKNGWCSEYQGELQVSSGKFGEIEVLDSGAAEAPAEEITTEQSAVEEPAAEPKPLPEESLSEEPIQEEETIE